jgi:hypothetical protein
MIREERSKDGQIFAAIIIKNMKWYTLRGPFKDNDKNQARWFVYPINSGPLEFVNKILYLPPLSRTAQFLGWYTARGIWDYEQVHSRPAPNLPDSIFEPDGLVTTPEGKPV